MHVVTIQGSDGGGRYRMTWVGPDEFLAEAEIHQFRGSARASIYIVGSPAPLFQDMAEYWRGWSGEKQWGDLDGHVLLLATSDSVGHVSLRVKLCDDTDTHSLEIALTLEAGHLEAAAKSVAAWSKLAA